jgi:hypothetical protein
MEVARPRVIWPSGTAGTAYLVNTAAVGCYVETPRALLRQMSAQKNLLWHFTRVKHNESHDRNILVGTVA